MATSHTLQRRRPVHQAHLSRSQAAGGAQRRLFKLGVARVLGTCKDRRVECCHDEHMSLMVVPSSRSFAAHQLAIASLHRTPEPSIRTQGVWAEVFHHGHSLFCDPKNRSSRINADRKPFYPSLICPRCKIVTWFKVWIAGNLGQECSSCMQFQHSCMQSSCYLHCYNF